MSRTAFSECASIGSTQPRCFFKQAITASQPRLLGLNPPLLIRRAVCRLSWVSQQNLSSPSSRTKRAARPRGPSRFSKSSPSIVKLPAVAGSPQGKCSIFFWACSLARSAVPGGCIGLRRFWAWSSMYHKYRKTGAVAKCANSTTYGRGGKAVSAGPQSSACGTLLGMRRKAAPRFVALAVAASPDSHYEGLYALDADGHVWEYRFRTERGSGLKGDPRKSLPAGWLRLSSERLTGAE